MLTQMMPQEVLGSLSGVRHLKSTWSAIGCAQESDGRRSDVHSDWSEDSRYAELSLAVYHVCRRCHYHDSNVR